MVFYNFVHLIILLFVIVSYSSLCNGVENTDPSVCSKHGDCIDSVCYCYPGFNGGDCENVLIFEYVTGKHDGLETEDYGSLGEFGGIPPATQFHQFITSPKFPDSIFKFFGYNGIIFELSSVWEYSISRNQWRWVGGSSTNGNSATREGDGSYFHENNNPGAWACGFSYLGSSEDVVLSGLGHAFDPVCVSKNKIWAYNLTTNQFREVRADAAPDYGTEGVFSSNVMPTRLAQWGGDMSVKRNATNGLISFGHNEDNAELMADIFEFDENSELFRLVKGPKVGNYAGDYVSKGSENIAYYPAGRKNHNSYSPSEDELWVFGGMTSVASSKTNDLWRYRFSTNSWTWISGSSPQEVMYQNPYPGEFHSSNYPADTAEAGVYSLGENYLISFMGLMSSSDIRRNPVWVFSIRSNGWLLAFGDADADGPQTVLPDTPGARTHGACAVAADFSNITSPTNSSRSKTTFYVLGGFGVNSLGTPNYLADMWVGYFYWCYDIDRNDTNVCSGNGNCIGVDTCDCEEGYEGDECQYFYCNEIRNDEFGVCGNNGECISPNTCSCNDSYIGDYCDTLSYWEFVTGSFDILENPVELLCLLDQVEWGSLFLITGHSILEGQG